MLYLPSIMIIRLPASLGADQDDLHVGMHPAESKDSHP